MGIKFSGYEHAPTPRAVSKDVIQRECQGEKTGCFLWDYDSQDDKVTFTTKILVRDDLSKQELPDVLQHERHHYDDFRRRAFEVKTAVEKAVKAGKDPALDDRLEWMMYDYCMDAVAYHRKLDRLVFDSCSAPKSDRPK